MTKDIPDDHLTPEEAAAFAALPREFAAGDRLAEERTVRAMRAAALLRPASRRMPRALTVALGVAAAAVIFAAGAAYGARHAARTPLSGSASSDVQQAGTAYVAALQRLSSVRDSERSPGLEVGAATLRAAATSLAHINPDDPIALRIRTSLNVNSDSARLTSDRSVIWF